MRALELKVYVVGLFPTVFATNRRHVFLGVFDYASQVKEYPSELLGELKTVGEVVKALASRGFKVKLIHACSPTGLLFTLRHRLGHGFYAVIDDAKVKIEGEPSEVVRKIMLSSVKKPMRKTRLKID